MRRFITILHPIKETLGLMLDRRVPWQMKLLPVGVLVYVLSPIDLIPEFLVGLGLVDDVVVTLVGLRIFLMLATLFRRPEVQVDSAADRFPYSSPVVEAEYV